MSALDNIIVSCNRSTIHFSHQTEVNTYRNAFMHVGGAARPVEHAHNAYSNSTKQKNCTLKVPHHTCFFPRPQLASADRKVLELGSLCAGAVIVSSSDKHTRREP